MAETNSFYRKTIEMMFEGKDSILELAKVLKYDPERQVCRIYTLTSTQYKDDVPLYFSSLYQNTGVISPPVEGSTSMVLWGPDRQPFLLPVQITTPYIQVEKAVAKLNASPTIIDKMLTLQNIQGGEHLIRSLGGAYMFLKNLGDVELGTHRLHRLSGDGRVPGFPHRQSETHLSGIPASGIFSGGASWLCGGAAAPVQAAGGGGPRHRG